MFCVLGEIEFDTLTAPESWESSREYSYAEHKVASWSRSGSDRRSSHGAGIGSRDDDRGDGIFVRVWGPLTLSSCGACVSSPSRRKRSTVVSSKTLRVSIHLSVSPHAHKKAFDEVHLGGGEMAQQASRTFSWVFGA